MNTVAIFLVIVIFVLLFILYKYFSVNASNLTKYADLNITNPTISNIQNATSTNYAYGVWVYVNSFNNSSGKYKVIFHRDQNIVLYLDKTSPTLYCDIYLDNNNWYSKNTGATKITITNNFPVQKWTYVTLSVDGTFLDAYLDGKLVVSKKVTYTTTSAPIATYIPKTPPTAITGGTQSGKNIDIGNASNPTFATSSTEIASTWDAYLANFQRWTSSLAPGEVWASYMNGNGQSGNWFTSYGVNMTVLQNNITQGTYTLI